MVKQRVTKAILWVGKPAWKRLSPKFYARIDKRIDMRLAQTESGWKQHVPAFLNAVSTVQAFGRELVRSKQDLHEEIAQVRDSVQGQTVLGGALQGQIALLQDGLQGQGKRLQEQEAVLADMSASVANMFDRIEFVRREIMYEMRYVRTSTREQQSEACARVLQPGKLSVAQANGGVRLNLGCGHLPMDGYINVDMRELPGVDIVADVRDLPFESGSLKEIFSAHLLEHFPQEELVRRLLPHWHDLLAPAGEFRAVAPDGEAMLAELTSGNYPFENFREVLFGAQEYDGDFHYNLLTPSSLSELLERAGFQKIRVLARGRHNGKCLEFEVSGIK